MDGSMVTAGRPPSLSEEARKTAILNAAERVFDSMGYGDATMEEIARAAGMAKKSVYKHFPDKGALFGALVDSHDLLPIDEVVMSIGDATPVQRLRRMLEELGAFILSPRQVALTRLVISEATKTPELSERFYSECVDKTQIYVATELQRGLLTGADHQPAIDPDLLADMFLGLILGSLHLKALMLNQNIDTMRDELERRVEMASMVMIGLFGAGVSD